MFGLFRTNKNDQMEQFRYELLNHNGLSSLSSVYSEEIKNNINVHADLAIQKENFSYIYSIAKELAILCWLVETGYGQKLKLKFIQLLYEDDFGDVVHHDSWSMVKSFCEDRLLKFSLEVDSLIPENIVEHARKTNSLEWCLCVPDDESNDVIIDDLVDSVLGVLDTYFFVSEDSKDEGVIEAIDFINDPVEYEHAVAELLTLRGWSAKVTKASGDQGADVLAQKNSSILVVQCKLYNQPVGNKAVQEVYAAKEFYNAQLAMVVTNSSFTKSAKQLAQSLNVGLFHHSQLLED